MDFDGNISVVSGKEEVKKERVTSMWERVRGEEEQGAAGGAKRNEQGKVKGQEWWSPVVHHSGGGQEPVWSPGLVQHFLFLSSFAMYPTYGLTAALYRGVNTFPFIKTLL